MKLNADARNLVTDEGVFLPIPVPDIMAMRNEASPPAALTGATAPTLTNAGTAMLAAGAATTVRLNTNFNLPASLSTENVNLTTAVQGAKIRIRIQAVRTGVANGALNFRTTLTAVDAATGASSTSVDLDYSIPATAGVYNIEHTVDCNATLGLDVRDKVNMLMGVTTAHAADTVEIRSVQVEARCNMAPTDPANR